MSDVLKIAIENRDRALALLGQYEGRTHPLNEAELANYAEKLDTAAKWSMVIASHAVAPLK